MKAILLAAIICLFSFSLSAQSKPVVGTKAPAFTLPDIQGRPTTLKSYAGKYVLLDFWGHWCNPCIRSFPALKALHLEYPRLALVGIAAEHAQDKALWIQAIRGNGVNWTQLCNLDGDEGQVMKDYSIMGFPTYVLLDRQGNILERTYDLAQIQLKLAALKDL
ncbi:hypothetical protein PK28_10555 [Hymenobacter sp. DG25B]|uniref:TlpA family protein disulfide reductase n=1 Tax=Hymenobacter sp. DG25B TaxID=1385664 RepID=UPI00054075EC|nr:TlpA family protein disulfide reductase [Hymenobacter sp. DG25B]AIZ64023.1 hypothetical protein PK28_10555 [Hymenobacter sp. DG25B]